MADNESYELQVPAINRALVVISLKQPYIDWVNRIRTPEEIQEGVEFDLSSLNDECTSFLIPEVISTDEFEEFLQNNWKALFQYEVSNWVQDRELWPKGLTYEMFREWFEVRFSSLVLDLCPEEPVD